MQDISTSIPASEFLKKATIFKRDVASTSKNISMNLNELAKMKTDIEVRIDLYSKEIENRNSAITNLEYIANNIEFIYQRRPKRARVAQKLQTLQDIEYHKTQMKFAIEAHAICVSLNEHMEETGAKIAEFVKSNFAYLMKFDPSICLICCEKKDKFFANICGHTYCQECWNKQKSRRKPCPACRETIAHNDLRIVRSGWCEPAEEEEVPKKTYASAVSQGTQVEVDSYSSDDAD